MTEARRRREVTLLGLLVFNGITAVGGGLALMTGWIPEQASWVRQTDFSSNYFPGVILMAVVGGSSVVAAIALTKRADGWPLATIVAGTIMVFWIIGEVASIRGFHFLQVIYLVTGALVVTWTPGASAEPRAPQLLRHRPGSSEEPARDEEQYGEGGSQAHHVDR